jgi:surface antigen
MELTTPSLHSRPKKRSSKLGKWSLIGGNILLLAVVASFIAFNRSTSGTIRNSTINGAGDTAASISNPLDQLSSSQIALSAAQMTRLPERTAIQNQADSETALLSFIPNDQTSLAKPQIVSTALKSKYDIVRYKTKKGDTVDKLASKFHLTVGSITGSNSLVGTSVDPGITLLIPPANGIVYKVKKGDTVNGIVNKYNIDKNLFVSVNDTELGIKPGSYIWIPNATEPTVLQAAVPSYYTSPFGVYNYTPTYGYNGYDYGFCTWYVASQISLPSNWGNANTWDDYARRTPGWTVSLTPRPGAIAQSDAGFEGHVGIVSSVSPDGSKIKYSDMNGLAGWGAVGYSGWVPAYGHYQHFIYHD